MIKEKNWEGNVEMESMKKGNLQTKKKLSIACVRKKKYKKDVFESRLDNSYIYIVFVFFSCHVVLKVLYIF